MSVVLLRRLGSLQAELIKIESEIRDIRSRLNVLGFTDSVAGDSATVAHNLPCMQVSRRHEMTRRKKRGEFVRRACRTRL
jgi:hypothetical protein